MKGVIFTEFLEMVDEKFGPACTESLIDETEPPSGGAYTAVGTYSCAEMMAYVGALEKRSGVSTPDLLRVYGNHLFGRFVVRYPELIAGYRDSFDLLSGIDDTIHVEVHKLYDDAELPRFDCTVHGGESMTMVYRSLRPLGDLAHGLIEGCAHHYGESVAIERSDSRDGDFNVSVFVITRKVPAPG